MVLCPLTRRAPDAASPRWRTVSLLSAPLLLAGCASLSPDAGLGPVAQTARERLGAEIVPAHTEADRAAVATRVAALLREPLSSDAAVQLALLNNRGLQAAFAELGVADADRVQALLPPNPGFGFGRVTQGDEIEWERGLHVGLGKLLSLPMRREIEARRFAKAQAQAAQQALALAADTRKAWVAAVAAEETLRYSRQVMQAAEAGAELARRMAAAGNFNKLQQAREQAFYAEAALGVVKAEQAVRASRERLTRLLGLWGPQTAFRLPERLPELPSVARELPDVERVAMGQRLDVQGARLMAEQTARQLGLDRVARFTDALEVGVMRNSSNEAPVQRGWELGLEIPLFDQGQARVARAQALMQQAEHRAAETAINARSEVREAYGAYRAAWDVARHHRDELVPLKRRISEENLLRYNGMLIGVFELLADARSQIASVNAAIEAQRDFWLAQADLEMALIGKPAGALAVPSGAVPSGAEPAGGGH
jgi:outer membrane protein TolC